jgi:hypothetical protein
MSLECKNVGILPFAEKHSEKLRVFLPIFLLYTTLGGKRTLSKIERKCCDENKGSLNTRIGPPALTSAKHTAVNLSSVGQPALAWPCLLSQVRTIHLQKPFTLEGKLVA